MSAIEVSRTDIEIGLSEIGLVSGSKVMVHSSLSSFGYVHGGAATVVAALKDVVTSTGTILMPSFNHGAPFREGGEGYFDPRSTPTTNGAIPEYFWRQPETYRSLNPTHPFAAWGHGAEDIVKSHHLRSTMGEGSPLHTLWQSGGEVLLMGVGFTSNTFHHMVESTVGAPCLGERTESYPVRTDDETIERLRTWGWRNGSCPFTDGDRYGEILIGSGKVSQVVVGSSEWSFFSMTDCYDVVADLLEHGLPPFPPCTGCAIRPRRTEWTLD